MSFARGLSRGLGGLPGVLARNQELKKEEELGEAIEEYLLAEDDAAPEFTGPPRPPKGWEGPTNDEDVVGPPRDVAPVRDQNRRSRGDSARGLARIYAEHGRPDQASSLLDRASLADMDDADRERQRNREKLEDDRYTESVAYARSRDRRNDALEDEDRKIAAADRKEGRRLAGIAEKREAEAWGRQVDEWRRGDGLRAGQKAYQAFAAGDTQLASQIVADNAEFLADALELEDHRRIVGARILGEQIFLDIENTKTGTTGPMTENASAEKDDTVSSMPLWRFGQMVGLDTKPKLAAPQIINGALVQFDADGAAKVLLKPDELGALGLNGNKIDSAEYKRVVDMAEGPMTQHYRFHLGSEFMKDPETAERYGFAQGATFAVVDLAYQNGMQFSPAAVGALSARLSLDPKFAALSLKEATKMAEEEIESGLFGRGEDGKKAVEQRARDLQLEAAQRLTRTLASTLEANPQQYMGQAPAAGAPQGETGPSPDAPAAATTPATAAAPEAAPAAPAQQTSPLASVPREQGPGPTLPPGPSSLERAPSPAMEAGRALQELGAQAWDVAKGTGLAAADRLRRGAAMDPVFAPLADPSRYPTPSRIAGAAGELYGSARDAITDFGVGLTTQPAQVPPQALGFVEAVRAGKQPSPEQVTALAQFAMQNPAALSEEEHNVLQSYVIRLKEGRG